jgi:16S rRNA (guanine(527)-N(7))-methyltransferase RsmG
VSYREILEAELTKFKIVLEETQKRRLAAYCDELVRWNATMNLTGLSGSALVRRLVVEPVWIAREVGIGRESLVDIGSGNGSPAIPFLITCSLRACHLIEARSKRAAFLRQIVAAEKLPNTVVHRARFEDVVGTLESPSWISLQAVALTDTLVGAIRRIANTTTTIVWITSAIATTPVKPLQTVTVPLTGTRVLLFRLDLP